MHPGHRALDVGCGPGALTKALASLLGPENVSAIDPSEPFVEACRARVWGVDVHQGRAEDLPFGDAEFDVVLAQLVVNHMSDPEAGVGEMRRVARPGATVAACVWDYSEGMRMLRAFWDAAVALDPEVAGPLDQGKTMPFCRPGELADFWRGCGFASVTAGDLTITADYMDFDDFWISFAAGVGPSGAYCTSLEPADREALRAECRRRLGSPEGPFELSARAWYVAGS